MKITNWKDKLFTTVLIVVAVGVMFALGLSCPFRTWLHVCCPGCGMTRAYYSLFRGQIGQAFAYHPMFWSVPIIYLFYLFDEKLFKQKWLNYTVMGLLAAGWLANWIRLLIHPI